MNDLQKFLISLAPYRKAVAAFMVGVLQLVSLYVALAANGLSPEDINALIASAVVALGGAPAAVYSVTNGKVTK